MALARALSYFERHGGGPSETYYLTTLLDIGYKIIAKIMVTRLNEWIERKGILKESQAGFRARRGTRDHIFTLNAGINNRLKKDGGKLYVAFVDFRAAFDMVDNCGKRGLGGTCLK